MEGNSPQDISTGMDLHELRFGKHSTGEVKDLESVPSDFLGYIFFIYHIYLSLLSRMFGVHEHIKLTNPTPSAIEENWNSMEH